MAKLNLGKTMKTTYVAMVIFIICTQFASCCFIRNCPPGGKKRSIIERVMLPVSYITFLTLLEMNCK